MDFIFIKHFYSNVVSVDGLFFNSVHFISSTGLTTRVNLNKKICSSARFKHVTPPVNDL